MKSKIVFLHNGDNWIRGSEGALLTILKSLDRSKYEPFVWCNQEIMAAEVQKLTGIEATVEKMPEIMIEGNYKSFQFLGWLKIVWKLKNFIKQNEIHAVYCNSALPCQFGYWAAWLAGVPTICHIHTPYNRRYIWLYNIARADMVISPAVEIERYMTSKVNLKGKKRVVYYGIDTERFSPIDRCDEAARSNLGISEEAFVIGQVGSLIHRKGYDILMRAFSIIVENHPHAVLLAIGEGEARSRLEELSKQLNIASRIKFLGERNDVDVLYKNVIDVAVLSSRSEALAISTIEATASGVPLVVSNVNGLPEGVKDGETGFIFESEKHEELALKLDKLCRDKTLREQMSSAARIFALKRFSADTYLKGIEAAIDEAVGVK